MASVSHFCGSTARTRYCLGVCPLLLGTSVCARPLPHPPRAPRAHQTLSFGAGPRTHQTSHALLPALVSQRPVTMAKGRSLACGNTYLRRDSLGRRPNVLRCGAVRERPGEAGDSCRHASPFLLATPGHAVRDSSRSQPQSGTARPVGPRPAVHTDRRPQARRLLERPAEVA